MLLSFSHKFQDAWCFVVFITHLKPFPLSSDGLSVSLDSLNGNYTSGWGAQSWQMGSRLVATWRLVAYGNADLPHRATAGTPMLGRWIKSIHVCNRMWFFATCPHYHHMLYLLFSAAYLSLISVPSVILSFAREVLLRFLLSVTLFQHFFFVLHPSSIHSSSALFCIISSLLSLVLHPLWRRQAQSKVNTTQMAPNPSPKHYSCSPWPVLL